MLSTRALHVFFGATAIVFILTLFSHDFKKDGSFSDRISAPFFSSSLSDRLSRSEKLYQQLVSQRASLMADYPLGQEKSLFPADGPAGYWKTPFSIWDFAPAAFNCPHTIQRLGRLGDGGKWLCGLEKHAAVRAKSSPEAKPNCVIYSFGIQAESSFEEELLKNTEGCEIWGYDFSVSKFGPQLHMEEANGRAHFTQAGIAGTTDATKVPPFYSIQDLMERNGHDHIDILKMDIEGFEFESMKSVVEAFFRPTNDNSELPIAQYLVEIHLDPGRINTADEFMAWWSMLEGAGFRPVWTEPNVLVSTIPLHDAKPRYSEYTFINIKDSKSVLLK